MRVLPPLVLVASMFAAGLALTDAYEDGFAAYANRNYAAALRFWAPIAEDGNVRAQNSMGILYQNGQGVPRDKAIAFKWYLRAALNGSTDAQYNIGLMPAAASSATSCAPTGGSTCRPPPARVA